MAERKLTESDIDVAIRGKIKTLIKLWCSPIVGQVLGQSKLVSFGRRSVFFSLSTPFSYQETGV